MCRRIGSSMDWTCISSSDPITVRGSLQNYAQIQGQFWKINVIQHFLLFVSLSVRVSLRVSPSWPGHAQVQVQPVVILTLFAPNSLFFLVYLILPTSCSHGCQIKSNTNITCLCFCTEPASISIRVRASGFPARSRSPSVAPRRLPRRSR